MANVLFVYSEKDSEHLNISFVYTSKEFEFNRMKNESLEKTLQRIALKMQQKKKKKQKQKSNVQNNDTNLSVSIDIDIFREDESVKKDVTNEIAFQENNIMKINNILYTIKVNLPKVKRISLPDHIMVDFPIFPDIDLLFATKEDSSFLWYISDIHKVEWKLIAESFVYVPKLLDINFYLKCVCIPRFKNIESPVSSEVISVNSVTANPGICPFDNRHLLTTDYLENVKEFRVVSYNILADVFVDSEYGKNILYPYCPVYALNYKYRAQLLLKELIGYHADIIALQECEKKVLEKCLMPIFKEKGYSSLLKLKVGEMPEGEGIIYRTNKFLLIDDFSLSVREMMMLKCNEYIMKTITQIPDTFEILSKTITIAQVVLFEYTPLKDQQIICVINTHLFYKGNYDDIRVLQMALIMNYVYEKLSSYEKKVSILLLGDLNACIGKPLLDYLNGIDIKPDHNVWKRNTIANDNKLLPTLKCPFQLSNFSGLNLYTNYVPRFQNTLDYIFGDKERLSCFNVIPLPEKFELDAYTALPSVVSPSDHLPVITDIRWKQN